MGSRTRPDLICLGPKDFDHIDGNGNPDPFAPSRFDRLMLEGDSYRQYAFLPNSGLRVIIEEDSVYCDLERTAAVQRLEHVSQLGIVTSEMGYAVGARHYTRFYHSLMVAALMGTILTRRRFPRALVDLGIVSGFLHDAAIPPYSDQGKLAALVDMDEERNIGALLQAPDIRALFRKRNLQRRDILACIRGEYPIIGPLLNGHDNIDADRIAYVACDSHFLGISDEMKRYRKENLSDIYHNIHLVDGKIAYRDAERVRDFLFLRALLFHDFYCGPETRGREALMKQALAALWQQKILDRKKLLAMTDSDLEKLAQQHLPPTICNHLFLLGFSEVDEVAQIRDRGVDKVRAQFPKPAYLVEEQRAFKPLTGTQISTRRGFRPFRKVNPSAAKELEELAMDCAYVGVYAVPREVQEALPR